MSAYRCRHPELSPWLCARRMPVLHRQSVGTAQCAALIAPYGATGHDGFRPRSDTYPAPPSFRATDDVNQCNAVLGAPDWALSRGGWRPPGCRSA